ncbi:hypothetical protein DRJ19_02675 [Candidatus Woesearchaeota archaeon]|nr:MAG: hypothetical protein DRJ19_02675 [Candidatus Woesearchaeota archaeon]RLG02921.1 MAG: hypothetical protein DRN61_05655 [Nitrososphaerota archaeon]
MKVEREFYQYYLEYRVGSQEEYGVLLARFISRICERYPMVDYRISASSNLKVVMYFGGDNEIELKYAPPPYVGEYHNTKAFLQISCKTEKLLKECLDIFKATLVECELAKGEKN